MMHIRLHTTRIVAFSATYRSNLIQTFDHEPGNQDEVFIFEYDYDEQFPLSDTVTSVALTAVAVGEEDAIIESAISATGVVGKRAPTPEQ